MAKNIEKLKRILLEPRVWIVLVLCIWAFISIHPFLGKPSFVRIDYVDTEKIPELTTKDFLYKIVINGTSYYISTRDDFIRILNRYYNDTILVSFCVKRETLPYIYENYCTSTYLFHGGKELLKYIDVSSLLNSYLRFSSDIVGGVRALLKPARPIDESVAKSIADILKVRVDVFGVKQTRILTLKIGNEYYFLVEIPGGGILQLEDLLSRQGKLYAKIFNDTVFTSDDIVRVCVNDPNCERILPLENGYYRAEFAIWITMDAAKRFREIMDKYLQKGYKELYLELYLDNESITKLYIDPTILYERDISKLTTGLVTVTDKDEKSARIRMRKLQAILSAKPLPVKLEIVSFEETPPKVGKEVFVNLMQIFIVSIFAVDLLLFLKYRRLGIVLSMFFIALSEILITLGIYAAAGWTVDLACLAAILASVGTGIDDQIAITEETLRGEKEKTKLSLIERIKRAFFIVTASYIITTAILFPMVISPSLFLRSFAFTSIIAITVGYFITRPTYARMIEIILEEGKQEKESKQ